jgi:hypothetical protein
LAASAINPAVKADQFEWRLGGGYEFMSQEYFFDSATWSGADSLIDYQSLTSTYLDDFKTTLSLDFFPGPDRLSVLRARYEQSSEFIRGRVGADLGSSVTSLFAMDGELEGRIRYRGDQEDGDDYLRAYSRLRLNQPLSQSVTLKSHAKIDGVKFRDPSEFVYDYIRVGGAVGLQAVLPDYSLAELSFFLQNRTVPDTSELSYFSMGANLAYNGLYGCGDFDLLARLERKTYRQPDDKDDHFRLELQGQNRTTLWESWFFRQEGVLEVMLFGSQDPVNYDYTRTRFEAGFGADKGTVTVSIGPALERLAEEASELLGSENYWEYGGQVEIDYLGGESAFLSAEGSWGTRDLDREDETQTGFLYQRLLLLADVGLARNWRVNLLFSGEWEWHHVTTEDSRLYLLSAGVTRQL